MLSGCVNSHPFTGMAYCVKAIGLYPYWGKCIHIGVGFDVARSTIQGNAKVSVRGTGDEENPRFSFILIATLG